MLEGQSVHQQFLVRSPTIRFHRNCWYMWCDGSLKPGKYRLFQKSKFQNMSLESETSAGVPCAKASRPAPQQL